MRLELRPKRPLLQLPAKDLKLLKFIILRDNFTIQIIAQKPAPVYVGRTLLSAAVAVDVALLIFI
jgi:hypothetical protein